MSLYSIILFLHVAAVLGLFASLSFEILSLFHLRRASDLSDVQRWIDPVPGIPLLAIGSIFVVVPTPAATETHRPIPHHEIVGALIETLGFRHIGVVHDEYAVSPDGMKMFGVLDLATEMNGCRFSIGLRNSHDKSMRLAMTCGYRVFVCSNMAFSGDFTPVLAKHSKSFSLIDCVSVGVDRMQPNFGPMRKQVEAWQKSELTDVTAKVVIYEAFVEAKLEAPKHLARAVHDLYFEPKYEEFQPRTIWSLSNAFTSAFKELDPIPQFKATAKLGEFLEAGFSQSF